MRLVQFETRAGQRRVARVDGPLLRLLSSAASVYALARRAAAEGQPLVALVERDIGTERVDYAEIIAEQRLLLPLDHADPAHVLVSGTGLTHLGSATTRSAMHEERAARVPETDSMRLFQLGVAHGKPRDGSVGVQPEWFYKGSGHVLARPGHPLRVPEFSLDAGEEPEIVGLYLIAEDGTPCRVGFALGNELSDHVTERQNYLYLAHSKLRACSFGPELLLGELPERLGGESRIWRQGQMLWQAPFESGESNMSHRISSLEHHHFKYAAFCQPGSVHVHFFGTATLSFAAGVRTEPGDVFEIECAEFGQPLKNTLERLPRAAVDVRAL